MNAPRNFIVRVCFSKRGKIRFISHRDVARIFERAIRVAGIPIAYSEGFSPRPRFSFGLALPTTFESDAEFVDLVLKEPTDPTPFPEQMSAALPDGLVVHSAAVLEPGSDSLQETVTASSWLLEVRDPAAAMTGTELNDHVAAWIDSILSASSIEITQERKGKLVTNDIRPAVQSLAVAEPVGGEPIVGIAAKLASKPKAVRPAELLEVFEPPFELLRGRRLTQWITSDGAQMALDVVVAAATEPHSELCAS